jgi:methionyl-tRNA synthetase
MITAKRYLITSALPYANGPLHIGHLAGAYISADIYARFLRLFGKNVVFVCGSDEHGAAITIRAGKEGVTPKEIIDKYHYLFKDTFEKIGISFDIYHRTSEELHHETSQDFFRTLYKKGIFKEQDSEQYYDEEANQFLADRYIKGKCPKCGHDEAYGDQCENCGSSLSPTDLINPVSSLTGNIPVLRKTTHWYLPLEENEQWLRDWIEHGILDGKNHHEPSDWKNHVVGQCKSWLDSGLQPRAMTRDLDWGVDVPHEIEGSRGKKLYVWMDAPIGYISATRQWAMDHGKDWKPYWQDSDTALVHFIGKDNIVFHCLIFPVILKAHGDYILPVNVPANQFMNLEGRKISTSKNWAVWVHEVIDELAGKEDVLRYNLIRNMPEQRDSEFTWKNFQETNNNELVNTLANFVHRVLVLTHKYYGGEVPDFDENVSFTSATEMEMPSFHDGEILALFDQMDSLGADIMQFDFRSALNKLMQLASAGNQLLQFNEPWKIQKEDPETVKAVMNVGLQYVAALSLVCRPFLPFTSDRLREMLNLPAIEEKGELVDALNRLAEGELLLDKGHRINEAIHLFTRIDDQTIEAQVQKLKNSEQESISENQTIQLKDEISFDDFSKLDMRTATIISAKKHPNADKLLILELDLGFEKRIVVSGIAASYKPENIIGKQVVLLANLAPRKIRGIQSQGMILMAENMDGNLSFVAPEKDWENGSVIS